MCGSCSDDGRRSPSWRRSRLPLIRATVYAWKLLGTSRFVQDDRDGALAAWNRAGEPRVDLVRIDGLTRTRHRVVERLVGLEGGDLVTPHAFLRARRRLAELPSAASARLEFVPVPSGLPRSAARSTSGRCSRPAPSPMRVWAFPRLPPAS